MLKTLLPRMLEDMFKLTLDVVFPKIKKRKESKKQAQPLLKLSQQKSAEKSPQKRSSTAGKNRPVPDEEKMAGINGSLSEAVLEASDEASPDKITDEEDKKSPMPAVKQKGSSLELIERVKPYVEPTIKIDDEKRAELYAKRIHPVNGYSDHENMWHKIGNIDSPNFINTNKHANKRSMFLCQVSDKVFKLKKNPAYPDHLLPRIEVPNEQLPEESPVPEDG